ncbi:MAG TPA: hypothetical protein VFG37_14225, partial [Planctomycetota bacterium]|nr:hypothetical protein [Planctomycetota bacterium]
MGDAAVPELARRLRDVHSRVVADCARMLAMIDTERSLAALADGVRDPEVAYPLIIANAPFDRRQPRNLPIARATFERPEKELHHAGALWMLELRGSLPPAEAAVITAKLIQEDDREVRETALSNCGDCDVARLLVPTLEPYVHSDDEARQQAAVRFFAGNRTCIPADVADEWTRALAGSRHPSVRLVYWLTQVPTGRDHDDLRLAECILALLGDEDPAVFSAGAENLKNTAYAVDSLKKVERDQHGAVFAATRRAIELAAVSSKHRDLVLSSVRVASLEDEELLDLFLRLAQRPADLSASRRAVLRARFARELVERHADSRAARDSFAAPLLSRIPDAAGRRAWLEITRNAGDGH